jgi:hypothetical protein
VSRYKSVRRTCRGRIDARVSGSERCFYTRDRAYACQSRSRPPVLVPKDRQVWVNDVNDDLARCEMCMWRTL